MSWLITGTEKIARDPYLYTNTVLLLKGDGANGSTTILDSSKVTGSPKKVTAVGNAQISTAQSKFGGSSLAFDGSGDWLEIPSSDDFNFGTGDFTVEAWVWLASHSILVRSSSVTGFELYHDIFSGWCLSRPGAVLDYTSGIKSPFNTWSHVALCRDATSIRVFVDGVQSPNTQTNSISYNLGLGGLTVTSPVGPLNGYIDELRITKGIARYANGTGANAGKMVFTGTNILALPTAPFPDF